MSKFRIITQRVIRRTPSYIVERKNWLGFWVSTYDIAGSFSSVEEAEEWIELYKISLQPPEVMKEL